ncbi:hypothetical protein ACH0B5_15845 [Ureibacillus sp. 179-F W5.1 NHS]|uniref:Nudix hydrolase domain-containing protein n=1 Tax=Lysinibacillus halotolerans TaxID=1368476 RepID=A0A3M8H5K3_9BACI|nr:hypothetical protein [Lysinibacillus halotolerans]RNC97692.1 hypothetical protein EC501_14150 [Lysinibacillus halotolerans]
MGKMDEIIIVAPRAQLFNNEELAFQGTLQDKKLVEEIVSNINATYTTMRRGDAEEDESFKQPIPYAVIKRGNEIFVYERLQGAGETRLHNKLSIGVGGHMNALEELETFEEVLMENLNRELEEELIMTTNEQPELKVIGLINDDEDEVGRVHLCVLVVIEVHENTVIEVRETDQLQGQFFPIEKLKLNPFYERLENWSKIAMDIL